MTLADCSFVCCPSFKFYFENEFLIVNLTGSSGRVATLAMEIKILAAPWQANFVGGEKEA